MRVLPAVFLVALSACAPAPVSLPANVQIGGASALPSPRPVTNDAPPQIIAVRFSALDVHRPQTWSGTFITTTNVAALELRTNQFSISVPRDAYGKYAFTLHVYDVPDEFIRRYNLRIIARNTAGTLVEEDVPFRIE